MKIRQSFVSNSSSSSFIIFSVNYNALGICETCKLLVDKLLVGAKKLSYDDVLEFNKLSFPFDDEEDRKFYEPRLKLIMEAYEPNGEYFLIKSDVPDFDFDPFDLHYKLDKHLIDIKQHGN